MEDLTLSQMQIEMLKTMIESYEKGNRVDLIIGRAAGKTTVGKIFNEYVRHKKENPDYKIVFNDNGFIATFGTLNFELHDGIGIPSEVKFKCEYLNYPNNLSIASSVSSS